MKKTTREWVRKAEADYRGANRLARGPDRLHDLVCFCCQQSAEKYLKALLEEAGQTVPKTHDLDKLLTLVQPGGATLRPLRRGLLFLTDFAVDTRYPGNWTSKRQAAAALRWAGRVRTACRAVLGLPPGRQTAV
jgi:HEPN domain-containing protein